MTEFKRSLAAICATPAGRFLIAVNGENGGISHLLPVRSDAEPAIADDAEDADRRPHPTLEAARMWLDAYFDGERPSPYKLPLSPEGTRFQHEVWDILLTIPYGETFSYGRIAKMIADARGIEKMSAQAVGGAVSKNPIAIVIPCHRVIGADGSLVGFGGGVEMLPLKEWLLTHEHARFRRT